MVGASTSAAAAARQPRARVQVDHSVTVRLGERTAGWWRNSTGRARMAELAANVTLTLVEFLDELPPAVRAHAIAMFFVWIVLVPLVSLLPLLFRHSERKGWLGVYIPSMISALGVTGYAINHMSTFKNEATDAQHFDTVHSVTGVAALALAGLTSIVGFRPGCSRSANYLQLTAWIGRSTMGLAVVAVLLGLSRVQDLFGNNDQITMLQIGVGAYTVSAALLMSALGYYIGYASAATAATGPAPLLDGDGDEEVALRLAAARDIAYPFPPRGGQGRLHAAGALGGGPGELSGPARPLVQGPSSPSSSSAWARRSRQHLRDAFRSSISYFRDSTGKSRAGGVPTAPPSPNDPPTASDTLRSDGKISLDVPQTSGGEAHATAPPLPPRKKSAPPTFPQPPAVLMRKLSSFPDLPNGPGPAPTTLQRQFQRNKLRIAKEDSRDALDARQDGASWA